jgi:diguanylate cyclase (GGDEF)-like protein
MAMVLTSLLLFGLVVSVTLYLKHVSERALQGERDLQAVQSQFNAQNALEWQAISGHDDVSLDEVNAALVVSRERTVMLIRRAGREGLSDSAVTQLETLHRNYTDAVDAELRLLGSDSPVKADSLDDSEVDPALQAAQQALTGYDDDLETAADRARKLSDLGILLTVGVALLITTGVQRRLRRLEIHRVQERRSGARYRSLVDQSADIAAITDREGVIQYLSPTARRMLGEIGDGPESADLAQRVHPDDRSLLIVAMAGTSTERRSVRVEIRLAATREAIIEAGFTAPFAELEPAQAGPGGLIAPINPDDMINPAGPIWPGRSAGLDWRVFEISIQDLCDDPAVGGMVLTGHDITDRHALQQEIEHRSLHDALTGLPNRALLADRLDQSLRAGVRDGTTPGLLLIDLDRFKEINDTLGHHYGDQLLTQIGPRLTGVLRAVDTVARLGGDEFAVLLPAVIGVNAAVEVANKLQEALGRSFQVEGVELDVEASIGVVVAGEHGSDTSTLMQRADIAMYAAKQRNLGVASYDEGSDSHTPEKLALLGDLRRALSSDELFLLYQPKVSLRTGEVCGAEALIRWQHPERGLISPDDFIPLAENTGLIGPLTTYVLDLALAQARRWVDQGAGLQVAVNLSARNLLDETLDETIAELLDWHGIDPGLLKLEITESAVMTDPTRAAELLRRLADQGLPISIDDFGAGYTSLRQLRDLPISELKVDRSFVTAMENDPSNSTIVRSVIELGHNLGMTAVAEGIESLETLNCLTGYACDVAQGYYLSRPLKAEEFEVWRASWPGLPGRTSRSGLPGRPRKPEDSHGVTA